MFSNHNLQEQLTNKMFHAKVLAILLVVGLSIQSPISSKLFDNTTPLSKKCQTAVDEKKDEVKVCDLTIVQKYNDKIEEDFEDLPALTKDVCALLKEEETQCTSKVKVIINT